MNKKPDIWLIIKWIILLIAWTYVVYNIVYAPDLGMLLTIFKNLSLTDFLIFALVIVLIPINWGIESFKWHLLLKPLHYHSFKKCFIGVIRGVSVGLATPNRLGEFAGRIMDIPVEKRASAGTLSISGSISQLFITFFAGVIGFSFIAFSFAESKSLFAINNIILLLIGFVLMLILLIFFFNTKTIAAWANKLPLIKKHTQFSDGISNLRGRDGLKIMLLSLFRYFIFIHQFYLLIYIFQIDISYLYAICSIASVYFIMAVLPIISAGEAGVRGSISILIFGIFTNQPAAIFAVSLLLWILNIAIPAMVGSIFILKKVD
ncbi:MAG: hypothetical protein GX879_07960 [Bacteroidales bacterium]|nr:hypothetical protein [Bacteroidales bacterium]